MANSTIDALRSLSAYPVPERALVEAATRRGLDLEAEATATILTSASYRLAVADIYLWLSMAPNISQGGQSFSFTEEQRTDFRRRAMSIYGELEPSETASAGVVYGYKGNRL